MAMNLQAHEGTTVGQGKEQGLMVRLQGPLSPPHPTCRANPVWLDPFCRNLELAAQAEHEDDLPESLSEIADLWNSPTRTHVSPGRWERQGVGSRVGRR